MNVFNFFMIGTALGLSAGFAPGPLLTLVISETLRHDMKAGIKVAVAPFITDLPIILFSILLISQIAHSSIILACIAFCGAVFIAKMGLENIRVAVVKTSFTAVQSHSLRRGIITNLLSPHPYLFWLGVGVPIMTKAMVDGISPVVAFLLSFYLCLVGSKVILAVVVGKSKSFLQGKVYIAIMRFLGVVLIGLAALLLYDGMNLLLKG